MVIGLWASYFALLYWRYYLLVMSNDKEFFQNYAWLLAWTDGQRRVELHPLTYITLCILFLHFYMIPYKELYLPSRYIGVSVRDVFEKSAILHQFVTRLPVWPLIMVALLGYICLLYVASGGGIAIGERGGFNLSERDEDTNASYTLFGGN